MRRWSVVVRRSVVVRECGSEGVVVRECGSEGVW